MGDIRHDTDPTIRPPEGYIESLDQFTLWFIQIRPFSGTPQNPSIILWFVGTVRDRSEWLDCGLRLNVIKTTQETVTRTLSNARNMKSVSIMKERGRIYQSTLLIEPSSSSPRQSREPCLQQTVSVDEV